MDINVLHFTRPLILWALILIPIIWTLGWLFIKRESSKNSLEKYIDPHLLPYLLVSKSPKEKSLIKVLGFWSLAALFLIMALAGPRWNLREIEISSRDQSLVMILDLSESMNAVDSKPTRLIRAKQKIEDLINVAREKKDRRLKLGLIAFAADPHMIAPLTEDKEMIRQILPSIGTDLVYVQGSRLSSALDMAASLLAGEPGNTKAILILSDGGYEDTSALMKAKKLSDQGIVIHTMGFGTVEGAPLKDAKGNLLKKNGQTILSKLEKTRLAEVSKMGLGKYLEPQITDSDLAALLDELETTEVASKKHELWSEGFYWMVIPALPILLWWFRRGSLFAVMLVGCQFSLAAFPGESYFKNKEEKGALAYELGDYESACDCFEDPYKKGVALYKAGKFEEAEQMFSQSERAEVGFSKLYNLGNSYAKQQKFKEAIKAYEDLLAEVPNHTRAKENLALVKQLQEDQPKQNSSDKSDSNKDRDDKKESDKSDSENDKDDKKEKEDQSEKTPQENPDQKKDQEEDKEPEKQPEEPEKKPQEEEKKESGKNTKPQEPPPQQNKSDLDAAAEEKSEQEQNAELWLNKLENDPKDFLKNKFYIESTKNNTKGGIDPW